MIREIEAGQVWEWSIGEEPWMYIQELYLLLHPVVGSFAMHLIPAEDGAWEALNLMTGALELVTPLMTAGTWERLS